MGGLFGGGGGGNNTVAPMALGLNIQSSIYGSALPIVYGRTRIAGNLIWYGAFTPIANTTTSSSGGKGGGGGGSSSTTYTYTTSFAIGLCEGPISNIYSGWSDKNLLSMGQLQAIFSIFGGAYPQAAWSYLTSLNPSQAIGYDGIAYVGAANYNLGNSTSIPNLSFEVGGVLPYNVAGGIYGSNPRDILFDLLTNVNYGAGFPSAYIGDLSAFSNFCVATGIFLSPAYVSQSQAQQLVADLMALTNCGLFFSEGLLKIVPLSDTAASGNGAVYTPSTTPIYNLNDDDFIVDGGASPITMNRGSAADAFNKIQLEFLDSGSQYNPGVAEASDMASINAVGALTQSPITAHAITDVFTARTVAQLILQRSLYVRNTFEFTLSWKYCLLEPGDIVTVTDSYLGLSDYAIQIKSIEEDAKGKLKVIAEDYLAGVSHAAQYNATSGAGWVSNYNAAPSNVVSPVLFEAPVQLATLSPDFLELWIATGGNGNYGGCQVWISLDGSTYKLAGESNGNSRYGTLTAPLTALSAPGVAGQTASIQMPIAGQLLSGTATDVSLLNTLCYVDGEYMAYETANLTGTNAYNLVTLNRGAYGSGQPAHAIGASFVRVDDSIIKIPLAASYIGQTLYVKLLAFNQYGAAIQSLANINPIQFPVTGHYVLQPPDNIPWFFLQGNILSWGVVTNADLAGYVIRYHYGLNTSWGDANPLHDGILTQSPYAPSSLPQGQITLLVCAIDKTGNFSAAPAIIKTAFGNAIIANVVETVDFQALGYPGTIVGGSVSGGSIIANSIANFYGAGISNFYNASPSLPFYNNYFSMMQYETVMFQPSKAAISSNMTLNSNLVGDILSIEYRPSGMGAFYDPVGTDVFYGVGAANFYPGGQGVYQPWPGQIVVKNINYQFRFTAGQSANQGILSTCNEVIDVPDVLEKLNGVVISNTGTRLPIAKTYTSIANVQLTLEADGGTAFKPEIVDKNNTLGPLIKCRDASGVLVSGTVDAIVQGY